MSTREIMVSSRPEIERHIGDAPLGDLVVIDAAPKLREEVDGGRLELGPVGVVAHLSFVAGAALRPSNHKV
jgi:hypothetical protein